MEDRKLVFYVTFLNKLENFDKILTLFHLDVDPPDIINCPNTLYAYTEKMSKTANVTWTIPLAMDNSGSAIVDQIKGPGSGSNFQIGLTEIRYMATDAKGNQSPDCIFFVNVEGIAFY